MTYLLSFRSDSSTGRCRPSTTLWEAVRPYVPRPLVFTNPSFTTETPTTKIDRTPGHGLRSEGPEEHVDALRRSMVDGVGPSVVALVVDIDPYNRHGPRPVLGPAGKGRCFGKVPRGNGSPISGFRTRIE